MIKVGTIYLTIINKIVHQFARQKKNSEWIYSSLSQKMAHSKLPTISIFAQPPHSTLNLTLRIKKVLQNSHLLLSYNPLQTHKFLNNKESESENKVNGEQTSNIIISQNNRSELAKWQNKGVEVEWSLELSKQLQLAIENQKIVQSNNDRQNRSLKKQQDELLSYIEMNDFKSKLQSFKNKHGFPQIGSLTEQLQNIAEWRKAGIAITCVIDQLTPRVSKQLFKYLQEQELPYEILPTYNQLVNMLAASGFPADRFSIQYFPKSFAQAFALRRPMKMTVALLINSKNLAQCISAIKQVYGKNQKIYLQNEEGTVLFRGEVDQFQLQNRPEGIIRLAISPYLSNFNEELKEQKSKISRLYGESMHENTHFVRMEFIAQQLEYLRKRKQKKEVVLQSMIKELIAKIQNDQKVVSIVATLTKVTLNQAKFLVQKAKQRTVQDYIGLQKFVKKN